MNSSLPTPAASDPVPERAGRDAWLTFAAVSSAVFLGTVDGSIVNIALPTLSEEFGRPLAVVQWVVLAYLLTQSTLALLVGRLGDMIGKKRIFTAGFVVFTVFSVVAAASPSVYFLIGARALQAVGGAMVIALGIAILTEAFPATQRGQVLGMIGAVVSLGIVTGPTLGGFILETFSWPWIFLVNLPVGIIGTAMAIRYVPDIAPSGRQRFDFGGAAVFLVSLLSLLLALSVGQEVGFGQRWIVVLFVASLVAGAVFVAIERRVSDPMLDLTMFSNVDFSIGIITGLLAFVTIGGTFIITPFYLTNTLDLGARTVGLVIASGPLLIGITAPLSGRASDRIGSRPVTVLGLVVVSIGFALLLRIDGNAGIADVVLGLAPIGAGIGIFQSPNNSAVMGSVPPKRYGVAGSLLSLNRIIGQTIGIAVLTAVWAIRLATRREQLLPGEIGAVAESGAFRDFASVALVLIVLATFLAMWALVRQRTIHRSQTASSSTA